MNGNRIVLDETVRRRLSEFAFRAYPCECCAALFSSGDGTIEECCELSNKSERLDRYAVDPAELYRCERAFAHRGYEIKGFFHSHPDASAELSLEDEKNMIPSMLYLLASVTKDGDCRFRLWRKDLVED